MSAPQMKTDLSPGSAEWLLAFADDEHMVGSRHASWIGLGPFLEEDLAFCSIAQDELGHAIRLYEFLTDDVDRFALLREPGEYRSAWVCEEPCREWDRSLVRHWLYDRAEELRWQAIADSSIEGLRDLSARALREEQFHRDHAEMFLRRIADGDETGRARVLAAMSDLLPLAVGLWEPVAGEPEALADGVTARSSVELGTDWTTAIRSDLVRWGFDVSLPAAVEGQAARTMRSESFPELLESLQAVITLDPAATW